MFVDSIDSKPLFTRSDGEIVRDLTQTMFELKNKNYVTYNVYRVPKEYVMRPDLISKAVYNNSIYAEIILKFNGISNPFSINEGDVILIPDLQSAKNIIKSEGTSPNNDPASRIRNSYKYIDPLKIPKKSTGLSQFDQRSLIDGGGGTSGLGSSGLSGLVNGTYNTGPQLYANQSNLATGALPPNIAAEGTSQITYRNGRVYFNGNDEACLKNGMSSSEFLTKVIKNKQ